MPDSSSSDSDHDAEKRGDTSHQPFVAAFKEIKRLREVPGLKLFFNYKFPLHKHWNVKQEPTATTGWHDADH